MKQIQPVSIWYNGSQIEATQLNTYVVSDNLLNTATFYYALLSADNIQLTQGNLSMTGFDYEAYNTSPDANEYAYNWVATTLKLTII
jgi:hypothetical protein